MDASDFHEFLYNKLNYSNRFQKSKIFVNKARLREYISYVPAEIEDFIDFRSSEWPLGEKKILEKFFREF